LNADDSTPISSMPSRPSVARAAKFP